MSKAVNFTEASYLALHAMALIAGQNGGLLSIRDIAEKLQVSEAHLAKVVQRLAHAGLVITCRGPKGGVSLAKEPADTSYLEIFEAMEGKLQPAGCVFGTVDCALRKCVFGEFLARITAETEEWLKSNTLAGFAAADE